MNVAERVVLATAYMTCVVGVVALVVVSWSFVGVLSGFVMSAIGAGIGIALIGIAPTTWHFVATGYWPDE